MKKRVWIIVLCLLLVGVFIATTHIELVGADSGFDSSFDSGGSDFGGSDYGGSSSSGDGGDLFFLIYLCFEYPPLGIAVLIIIALVYFSNKKKAKQILDTALKANKLELLNPSVFPEEKRLEIEAFNLYKQIQFAWMNFDEDTLRNCLTDEMYNMYLMQLDTLKVKHQKNIMYDIKYLGSSIKEKYEENGQETIIMNMQVSCYDFIINTKTNKVVRGSSSKLNIYSYELTFVRTKENKGIDICPQCGAPVEGNNSGVCEYCRSTLISNNYTLVMSKKKMLAQR